jgi:hypothetical protein
MVKISRDNSGKTRVAKGDNSGLGGQYAPDPAKIASAKNRIAEINNISVPDNVKYLLHNLKARSESFLGLEKIETISQPLYEELLNSADEQRDTVMDSMTPKMKSTFFKGLTENEQNNLLALKTLGEEKRERIINNYVVASMWTDVEDDNGDHTIFDLSEESRNKFESEFNRFVAENRETVTEALETEDYDEESFGYDLWLTRTRQGVGFWDRPQLKANRLGQKLTEAVDRSLPPISLIVGDDNKLYFE